jgi:putative MATE family efflux protein
MQRGKLVEGNIGMSLVKMSIPMFFGMIGFAMFNFFDTKFVGELGVKPLAAISYTIITVLIMFAIAFGLGTGVTATVGKAIGENNESKAKNLTTYGLILSLLLGILITLIGFPTIGWLFKLLGASNELMPYIFDYMQLWYIGVPLIIVPIIGNSAIRAHGNTLIPALIMGVCVIFNIFLDYGLILGNWGMPKWEVFGASLATFVSRFMTLVASLLFLHFKFNMVSLKNFSFKEMLSSWFEILKIGVPSILTQLVIPLSVALIVKLASGMENNEQLVSTLQVGSRIDFFAIAIVASLGTVLVPFIAQNFGAKNYKRIKSALKISRLFTIAWGIVMTFCFVVLRDQIGPLFLKDKPDPIFFKYMSDFYLIIPFSFIFRMIFAIETSSLNALQKPIITGVLTFIELIIIYYPLALFLSNDFGYQGIFYAFVVATLVCGIAALIINSLVLKSIWRQSLS